MTDQNPNDPQCPRRKFWYEFAGGAGKYLGIAFAVTLIVGGGWYFFKDTVARTYDSVVPDAPSICWLDTERACGTWAHPSKWFSGDEASAAETATEPASASVAEITEGTAPSDAARKSADLGESCEKKRSWYNPVGLWRRCADE